MWNVSEFEWGKIIKKFTLIYCLIYNNNKTKKYFKILIYSII